MIYHTFPICLQDQHATRYIKDEKISRTAFVANCCILLCICTGFSLVTVAEILYHTGLLLVNAVGGKKSCQEDETINAKDETSL